MGPHGKARFIVDPAGNVRDVGGAKLPEPAPPADGSDLPEKEPDAGDALGVVLTVLSVVVGIISALSAGNKPEPLPQPVFIPPSSNGLSPWVVHEPGESLDRAAESWAGGLAPDRGQPDDFLRRVEQKTEAIEALLAPHKELLRNETDATFATLAKTTLPHLQARITYLDLLLRRTPTDSWSREQKDHGTQIRQRLAQARRLVEQMKVQLILEKRIKGAPSSGREGTSLP